MNGNTVSTRALRNVTNENENQRLSAKIDVASLQSLHFFLCNIIIMIIIIITGYAFDTHIGERVNFRLSYCGKINTLASRRILFIVYG